jgi:hypothetical protein
MTARTTRRNFLLRGAIGGGAVAVGLPLLDRFLDVNGEAMAATLGGGRLPVRFGTWFWGCGMVPSRWEPKTIGANYDLPPELMPIKGVQQHVNILTGYSALLDGAANQPHITGNIAVRTGTPRDSWQQISAPTLDVLIADQIGSGSYFRSLDLSADGNPRTSYSYRDKATMNAATPTAQELYAKVFGADFHDPNAAEFKPDVRYMVRKSVLTGVTDERRKLIASLGAEDRQRMDQYFTSIREVEQKLALQLEKPAPADACVVPSAPASVKRSVDVEERRANHKAMAQLLAMALACNQTKVFNLVFSEHGSDLRQAGHATAHHQATHEEMVDRELGYQPTPDYFSTRSMEAFADFVEVLAGVREGAGTLLDNTLVMAHSDVSFAKNHDVNGIPVMLAGRAGGRMKTGIHVRSSGEAVTKIGLTVQQAMGLSVDTWGTQSMQARKPISELMA